MILRYTFEIPAEAGRADIKKICDGELVFGEEHMVMDMLRG